MLFHQLAERLLNIFCPIVTFIFPFQISLIFLTFVQNLVPIGALSMFELQNTRITIEQHSTCKICSCLFDTLNPVSQSHSLIILVLEKNVALNFHY